jgi:HPt (histidine-containing phosphotransfer) domain-containing protein
MFDFEMAQRAAHDLCGMAGTMGLFRLSMLAGQIEAACTRSDQSGLEEAVKTVELEADRSLLLARPYYEPLSTLLSKNNVGLGDKHPHHWCAAGAKNRTVYSRAQK